jgi:hypothetical protein
MLQEHLGLKFPRLNLPGRLLLLTVFAPPALLVSLRAFWGIRLSVGWIAGDSSLLILLTFLRIIPAVEDDIPLSRVIPEDCESFGGLVRVSLARNYAAFASQNGGPSEGSVVEALRQLAAAQAGIDLEKFGPETRIPNDLDIY